MEMHHIRYFLAICEHGGFSRAAEACGVPQPALTTAVKRLEKEVGGDLFMPEYSVTLPRVLTRPLIKPEVVRTILAVEVRGRARTPAAKLLVGDMMRDAASRKAPR